jgi:hypothetical protein
MRFNDMRMVNPHFKPYILPVPYKLVAAISDFSGRIDNGRILSLGWLYRGCCRAY